MRFRTSVFVHRKQMKQRPHRRRHWHRTTGSDQGTRGSPAAQTEKALVQDATSHMRAHTKSYYEACMFRESVICRPSGGSGFPQQTRIPKMPSSLIGRLRRPKELSNRGRESENAFPRRGDPRIPSVKTAAFGFDVFAREIVRIRSDR